MMLLGVKKDGDWLYSEWQLTYRVGWGHITSAAALIYEYTKNPELFVGDANGEQEVTVGASEEIRALDEGGYLTIRGVSEILRVPMVITFYNQMDLVRATVACATEEFRQADYKKFNLSLCQFMDSAEIAMYE